MSKHTFGQLHGDSRPEHDLTERCCGVGLHAWKDVLVHLHRERHAGVAEPFADDLDRNTGLEEESGVGVTQVVQPDPAQAHLGDESLKGP